MKLYLNYLFLKTALKQRWDIEQAQIKIPYTIGSAIQRRGIPAARGLLPRLSCERPGGNRTKGGDMNSRFDRSQKRFRRPGIRADGRCQPDSPSNLGCPGICSSREIRSHAPHHPHLQNSLSHRFVAPSEKNAPPFSR